MPPRRRLVPAEPPRADERPREVLRRVGDVGELPVEHRHEPVLVDHQVADPEVAVVDDPRPLEREPLPAPDEPELDRGMRLVDLVELGVQALPEIGDGQLGQRRDRDRVHLRELVGHLQRRALPAAP